MSFILKSEAFLREAVLAALGCKAVSVLVHASPTPLRPNPAHHVFPLYRWGGNDLNAVKDDRGASTVHQM